MTTPLDLGVDPTRAALLIIDVQERLAAAMPAEDRARCERQILTLIELARRLHIPITVSEQYPKGLGPTVPAIDQALRAPDTNVTRFEKVHFACTDAPSFLPLHTPMATRTWLLTGMETHVCVYLTARGLASRGTPVQIVADAVCSRRQEDRRVGLALAERAGATITTTETVVFDALGCAGTDDFRALSKLVK